MNKLVIGSVQIAPVGMCKRLTQRGGLFGLLVGLLAISSCGGPARTPADHPEQVAALIVRAGTIEAGNPRAAVAFLRSAFAAMPKPGPGDRYQEFDFLNNYAQFYTHDYVAGMRYADSMIAAVQPYRDELKYHYLYAEGYLREGDALFNQERFYEAFRCFYQGKIVVSADDSSREALFVFADLNARLANVSYGQGRYRQSAAFNKLALGYLQRLPDGRHSYQEQGVVDNMALSYSKAGMPDSALYYYAAALKLIDKDSPSYAQLENAAIARAVIYGNEGSAYLQRGDTARAEQLFKQNIAINSQPGYAKQDALITRMKLAELYVRQHRLAEAEALLNQVHAAHDSLPSRDYDLQLLRLEALVEAANGQDALAYTLSSRYATGKDSLQKGNTTRVSADFTQQFGMLQRQLDLATLQRQYEFNRIYLFMALVGCIMAGVILYLAFKSRKKDKAAAREAALNNQRLTLALNALEKSNEEYAHLLRVVAHDLKNPINAIHGLSALMIEDSGRSAEDKDMLELIRVSSLNLNSIIHDLLVAKINQEPDALKRRQVSLTELLEECRALLQLRADEKRQRIVITPQPDCTIHINRDRLWRVFNNLLVNAIKFSPEDTVITIGWEQADGTVTVRIQDQGIGIPKDIQEEIFRLSQDTKRAGTAGEESFGLGLYISRQIIEEHGGEIWLESAPGEGTTFFVKLPCGG
jgi:signal transduction histidine kinase